MNNLVYDGTEINSQEELVARIAAAAGEIRDRVQSPSMSCDELVERCMTLRDDVQGRPTEHIVS